ncbi:MAG: VWA-like domain-containing protein [Steroidobacteraceae bacterium]|jgi:predicted metal-dependent peptidase|nr:VWA-like domain-containing protein [Steroidobacteraceae bacterium]
MPEHGAAGPAGGAAPAVPAAARHGHRGTRAIQRMVEYAPSTGGLALWIRHVDLPAPDAATAPGNARRGAAQAGGAHAGGAGAARGSASGWADRDVSPVPHARSWGRFAARRAPVATDGTALYYDAAFEGLPLPQQAGQVAHQVLHVALRHPQRFLELRARLGDVDLQLYNTCADAIVNSALGHLGWLELPQGAVNLERLLKGAKIEFEGIEQALLEWDVERLYRAVDDRRESRDRSGRNPERKDDGEGTGGREDGPRAASVRALGADDGAADLVADEAAQGSPEEQAEASREWSERILRAHAGDGAFSMLRTLLADLPASRVPWEQVLRTRLAHALSRRPSLSWSRPSRSYLANQGRAGRSGRRMPWEPGHGGTKAAPRLALLVDVSGSIEAPLLERFTREIQAILRRQEAALTLVIGDDQVRRVEQVDPDRGTARRFDLREVEFHGGGGTDFTPLLEEADRHRPDIAVVLTDLEGPARFRPRWPVIWAVPPAHAATVAPFGRLLVID